MQCLVIQAAASAPLIRWLVLCSLLVSPILAAQPAALRYKLVQNLPHNSDSFTQGLIVHRGSLIESSGLFGRSFVQRYDLQTGKEIAFQRLPSEVFAEGLTEFKGKLYVLTWKAGKLLMLDAQTLQPQGARDYDGEGWGLTHNGEHFIVSDGSDSLKLRRLDDFSRIGTLKVSDPTRRWTNLNELEYAKGYIWANVWRAPVILAIDPADGKVAGVLDLSGLAQLNNTRPGESVLNGIAYDPETDTFWVTGKLWPRRYEIDILWPKPKPAKSPKSEHSTDHERNNDSDRR